jgi:hypothetical protein
VCSHDIALIWLSKRGFGDNRGGALVSARATRRTGQAGMLHGGAELRMSHPLKLP